MAISRIKPQKIEATSNRPTCNKKRLGVIGLILVLIVMAGISSIHTSPMPVAEAVQTLKHLTFWPQVPTLEWEVLLAPTVILLLIAFGVMQLSPLPRPWSRTIIVIILLTLTLRYLTWRLLTTLNLTTPLNQFFSISLFGLELLVLAGSVIQLILLLRVKDRRREADRYAVAVMEGKYCPGVDILIPTYNEPALILRRTVIGCQAIDYPNKQVYLLDDTRRPEIKALATELGCHYLTRPDNRNAKAGNLNHAIAQTRGELVAVFDADFIPTFNFLTRTVGFFQNQKIALVQTSQSFYSPDPIARNLGLENILTPEEEIFYRQTQPMKDGVGSAICSGTSFVVRRNALEETGGFITNSLSEDYFTGVQISSNGHQLVYLDEKLSAGLAAETMTAHAIQRLRWARGTLQAFFIQANPLTVPGLTPLQRLAHLEGLLYWFTCFSRIGFLLIPLAYAFFDVIPVIASPHEVVYFFLPYYGVNFFVFSWLNYRSRSAIFADIYGLAMIFPLALTVIQVMINPFSKGFRVTPKGNLRDRYSFNWDLAMPLLILWLLTAVSFALNWNQCVTNGGWAMVESSAEWKGLNLGFFWSAYNLIMLTIALLILLDAPKSDPYEWLKLKLPVEIGLKLPSRNLSSNIMPHTPCFTGVTTVLSEGGAEIVLPLAEGVSLDGVARAPVRLKLLETQLQLQGRVTQVEAKGDRLTLRVQFESMSLEQHRQLVELLFCRPGRWRRHSSPGEFHSLLLLFKILLKPKILFGRRRPIQAIAVAKG